MVTGIEEQKVRDNLADAYFHRMDAERMLHRRAFDVCTRVQQHLWFLESGEKFSQQERIARTANLVGLGLPKAEPEQKP